MPWRYWCLFVALGLGVSLGIAWVGVSMRPARVQQRERAIDPQLLAEGVRAFESGDWKASVRAFERVLTVQPGHARALDYLDRIELTLQDADRLRRSEEALVAGETIDAERTALTIAPNSPLYAQAEALARTSQKQREPAQRTARLGEPALEGPLTGLSVQAALGEALALYEAARFADADARALSLAEQATPETRQRLLAWAQDCRKFAQHYTHLPEDDLNFVRHTAQVAEAIELDERLSDGHFARKLREQMARALSELSRVLLDGGDALGGCERAKEAQEFDARNGGVAALIKRCDAEAGRKIDQARAMESERPEQALRLLRQALALSSRNSREHRNAQKGVSELSWSEER